MTDFFKINAATGRIEPVARAAVDFHGPDIPAFLNLTEEERREGWKGHKVRPMPEQKAADDRVKAIRRAQERDRLEAARARIARMKAEQERRNT